MDVSSGLRRLCFALDLADDAALIAQYCAWHAPGRVPEPVNRSMREAGIFELELWRTGNRLFMVMEVGRDFSLEGKAKSDAADPDVRAWEEAMWRFQRSLPWAAAGEKWVAAEKIYALSEQP